MTQLETLLQQLEQSIARHETLNQAVSQASVGWHIEHTLLTLNGIQQVLAASDPARYRWRFSLGRLVFFTFKRIPRGRAKSPEVVLPKGPISAETLTAHLARTRAMLPRLAALPAGSYFHHPYFGNLRRDQALQFLEIHTRHHVAIIADILAPTVA
jgi:hypothetical protein